MDESSDAPEYDPADPTPPAREPPRRSTAPQSESTVQQVGFGLLVLALGVALVAGLALALA